MAGITFASRLKLDGSVTVPVDAVETLGLRPGDSVRVRVEAVGGLGGAEGADQDDLQARLDRFFDALDRQAVEGPALTRDCDPAEAAFVEAMDEKYRRLGFEP